MAELPPVPCMRAEGEIRITLRVGGRAFDPDLCPVGIELFGGDGGDAV